MQQLSLPFKKNADEIAGRILESIKDEPEGIQQAIVCEIYYLTICGKLDQMPQHLVNGLIVKLIERYFATRGEDEKSLVKKGASRLPG
jgi:hypothetical protein